jgi:hypothetical protein
MAYSKDFTVCTYFDTGAWLCRLVAIGWIEHGKPFETGPEDSALVERIGVLREAFSATFPSLLFRGLHDCSICAVKSPSGATLAQR